MLKALLIDDEAHCAERIKKLLVPYESTIQLLGTYTTVDDGIKAIEAVQPDVVFLDIQIHDQTGFDLLDKLATIPFEVIFTTAHNNYAIDAFKYSALDYLLKPITKIDFDAAVLKFQKKNSLEETTNKLKVLFHNLSTQTEGLKKMAIPTLDGFVFVAISEIIRCESDGNYTHITLKNGEHLTASKTLKHFEDVLPTLNFFRIHKSHLINLNYVEKYLKGKGGYVQMNDGKNIEVAVRRKEGFLQKLLK
ncbi:LytR/AlgR family response regulator transcription factor [Ulvibacter litoralis]|uniref:Two-component system, LytT family, response regulator n=1 Tax=Ulvibacter litoralis TaxID=227084 RepID=A0A1G7DJ28_9FLAO|nr:LytTR family DNA-binding domain-containing protein [Ulvibacter litoralis]GHC43254.1 DNA-binding response regulator [Ulvibacter litoralis]SDE51493.1 two-component system, LytT family, response regulator [Ulvibacter litoralis]